MKTKFTKVSSIKISLSIALFFICSGSFSQFQISTGLGYAHPMKEMAKELQTGPVSWDLNFGYRMRNTPFTFGLTYRLGNYSSVTTRAPYVCEGYQHSDADYTINYNVKSYLGDAKVFVYKISRFSTFIEGAAGFNLFKTAWYAADPYQQRGYCQSPNILDRGRLARDWAFTYGAGGGIKINEGDYYLEFSVIYMKGKTAAYLSENRHEDDVNNTSTNNRYLSATATYTGADCADHETQKIDLTRLQSHRSPTDMLAFRVGVGYRFHY